MDKRLYVELPPFTGRNVPITEIAKAIGKDAHYVRIGIRTVQWRSIPPLTVTPSARTGPENRTGKERHQPWRFLKRYNRIPPRGN